MEIKSEIIVRLSVCDFFDFLEKDNALLSYRENLLKNIDPLLFFRDCNPMQWLSGAFTWENTKEGKQFWRDLNEKWHKYMQYELYENCLEKVFWEIDNSEELIIKNFVDLRTGLMGKWYQVFDNSYNRPVVEGKSYKWIADHKSWLPLAQTEKEYLILSDTPEVKEVTIPGISTKCEYFIKVWVPEENQAQYVLFYANRVTDEPTNPAKK